MSRIRETRVGVTADLQARSKTAFRERLFAIMSIGYEAELHSQAGRARRRGGVPQRCPAPQFSRAAAELGVTPSAMSQAVRALEARIGAALFIRTTRSVGLTEAGERFLLRAKPAFEELVAASEVARDLGQRPAGLLRLTAPRAVVPILLESLIASFCQAYPDIEVEIAASPDMVDIAAEGFDAGIRHRPVHRGRYGRRAAEAAVPVRGRRQPRLSAPTAAAGTHRRSAPARLPAHAPLERLNRALVLSSTATRRSRRSFQDP